MNAPTVVLILVFPGGLLSYADWRGVRDIVQTLERLAKADGSRYLPCPRLVEMAQKNERYYCGCFFFVFSLILLSLSDSSLDVFKFLVSLGKACIAFVPNSNCPQSDQ